MTRLADGDRGAFDALIDELWPVILSFARRGLGRDQDAEDVAQEVFFKICSRSADFDRSRDALSWAFGIASYEILTQRRRRQRSREVPDEALIAAQVDAAASQEERLLQGEQQHAFAQAVAALADADRRSLGLEPDPRALGLAGAALRKRKQRALLRLRDLWRSLHGEP
jgi:RNA polymerase sigma factor (sigma-70 family)